MNNTVKRIGFYSMFVFTTIVLLNSCVTNRYLEYVQDPDKSIKEYQASEYVDYKLKPNDELLIQVSSLDDAGSINGFSNPSRPGTVITMDQYGASLLSYSIDKDGYMEYPVIGKILVKDKTIYQVTELLRTSLSNVYNQPVVSVKLIDRFVTVLGEVRNPGHFVISQNKISVYDAIGMAGDITDFGNRHNVILIRYEDGKNLRINLNLNSSDILKSDYYFLRPNDIVYVKPLKKKFIGFNQFPFSVVLSALTTFILFFGYVAVYHL